MVSCTFCAPWSMICSRGITVTACGVSDSGVSVLVAVALRVAA
ncbi:Uncharacterised protein [Bordetella pertussis]|nr:Uncharacterised protein [Bordetella pertussis]CFW41396.1 Uncharacterised protein [Bordetella pertussis]